MYNSYLKNLTEKEIKKIVSRKITIAAFETCQTWGRSMALGFLLICLLRPFAALLIGAGMLVMTHKGTRKGGENK